MGLRIGTQKVTPIIMVGGGSEPVLETITVTPTTSAQTITPTGTVDGFSTISVAAVTASIDSDIQAANIKSGVNILGVDGSVVELKGQTKTFTVDGTTPTVSTLTPDSTYNALTSVKIDLSYIEQSLSSINGTGSSSGTTPVLVTKTITENGTYNASDDSADGYSSISVSIASGGSSIGLNREVVNGKYSMPTTSFTFSLPSNVTDVGRCAMNYAFYGCTSLTSVNLSSLTTVSGYSAMSHAFYGCTSLTSVDLSNLATLSGGNAMNQTFYDCTSLTSVDLSNLATLSGGNAMYLAFYGCTSLTSVDLSSLTTVSGNNAMSSVFEGCEGLVSVDLSSLTTLSGGSAMNNTFCDCTSLTSVNLSSLATMNNSYAMVAAFEGCIELTTLSFPSLTSTSFGSYTNQFDDMLTGVTGCTVHFPSNLQSVIGSWSSVTSGFGGTNTTVLFDLPATT